MASTTYLVTNKKTKAQVFVKAASKQAAVQAITLDDYTVEVASKDNLTDLLPMGIKIIDPSKKIEPAADNTGGEPQQ